MGQRKLVRFAAIKTYDNVLQYPEGVKGTWSEFFGNDNPITLELACGKGEYSVALGREHPERNFIGIDIKGNRLYVGAKTALRDGLKNVAFLRVQIGQLTHYFAPEEVSEIWILFPDPFLKKSRAKNRLTHARFLYQYQQVLKPGGIIHLKTDSRELYEFTLETIAEQGCPIVNNWPDIYGTGRATGPLAIRTFYEGMHLADGRTIYYVSFTLPPDGVTLPERFARREENADAADD